jgi:hypothetical protein
VLAESLVDGFKTELIVDRVWFHSARLHQALDVNQPHVPCAVGACAVSLHYPLGPEPVLEKPLTALLGALTGVTMAGFVMFFEWATGPPWSQNAFDSPEASAFVGQGKTVLWLVLLCVQTGLVYTYYQRVGRKVVQRYVKLPRATDPHWSTAIEQHTQLRDLLHLDVTPTANFQAGVATRSADLKPACSATAVGVTT